MNRTTGHPLYTYDVRPVREGTTRVPLTYEPDMGCPGVRRTLVRFDWGRPMSPLPPPAPLRPPPAARRTSPPEDPQGAPSTRRRTGVLATPPATLGAHGGRCATSSAGGTPLCEHLANGEAVPATQVDHIIPGAERSDLALELSRPAIAVRVVSTRRRRTGVARLLGRCRGRAGQKLGGPDKRPLGKARVNAVNVESPFFRRCRDASEA
jgi:hypothetical protein